MLILMSIYFLPMLAIFRSTHKWLAGWLAGSFHNVYILKNRSTNFTHKATLHCQKPVFCVDERKIMANKMYIYICDEIGLVTNAIRYFIVWCFEKNVIEKYTNSKSNETITKIVCTLIDELQRLWSVEHFALKTFSIIPRRWKFDGNSMEFFFLLLNWFLLC